MVSSNRHLYGILSIKDLLSLEKIQIPQYQRPYQWTVKNVNQLIDDILAHKQRSAYRLGTLVIHKEIVDGKEVFQVVDGQQRCITLTLIAHEIFKSKATELKKISARGDIEEYKPTLMGLSFESPLSQKNIFLNHKEIQRRVRDFNEETIRFFFYRCQLVQVVIEEISEAFQFFDSQNARGKDLEPHDLLKAFHLREMVNSATEDERIACVAAWEKMESDELVWLFGNYLYRMRNWSKGRSARYFTKDEVEIFKGIAPEEKGFFPYAALSRIGHFYVDAYNKDDHRNIDNQELPFPFQIDQIIINGKRFFELIAHYKNLVDTITSPSFPENEDIYGDAQKIFNVINDYEGKYRKGDASVRCLFDCALIYYMDRFGKNELSRAIEKIFVWAYSLRLNLQAVRIESVDNHALGDTQLFQTIREARSPHDLLNLPLDRVKNRNHIKHMDDIKKLFTEMNYYET